MGESTTWFSRPHYIFISYAREDARDEAIRLHDDLVAAGHTAWLDMSEIHAGSSWSRDIEEAIERCDIFLALLSTGSYVSDICRSEQLRALRKGKRVIPLMIQPDADRPIHLENLNYLDFSNLEQYDELLSDLIDYITTGQMPSSMTHIADETGPMAPVLPPKQRRLRPTDSQVILTQKRDARAFKRYIADLRDEPWLGERYWWTYFLFYYDDVQNVADILQNGLVVPPKLKDRRDRLGNMVRLYFRPRTPDLFGAEGIRPGEARGNNNCDVPVYLVFDFESVITLSDVRFSEGDVAQTRKTFKTATAFRDLPFDLIYHDAAFRKDERDEILIARKAQTFVPNGLDLIHLKHIWCRSTAEYETLYTLLPDEVWYQWGDKITVRADYDLFNRHWVYVNEATLSESGALFQFNACADCGVFDFRAEIETASGEIHHIDLDEMLPQEDFGLDLTGLSLMSGYRIRLYLDDALAYAGQYRPPDV